MGKSNCNSGFENSKNPKNRSATQQCGLIKIQKNSLQSITLTLITWFTSSIDQSYCPGSFQAWYDCLFPTPHSTYLIKLADAIFHTPLRKGLTLSSCAWRCHSDTDRPVVVFRNVSVSGPRSDFPLMGKAKMSNQQAGEILSPPLFFNQGEGLRWATWKYQLPKRYTIRNNEKKQ